MQRLNPHAAVWRPQALVLPSDSPVPSPPHRAAERPRRASWPQPVEELPQGARSPSSGSSMALSEVGSSVGDAPSGHDAAPQSAAGSWCPRFSQTASDGSIMVRTPWYPAGVLKGGLELGPEIADFHRFIAPTAAERAARTAVRCMLQELAAMEWPHATVKIVGSAASGFSTHESELDLVVEGAAGAGPEQLRELAAEQKHLQLLGVRGVGDDQHVAVRAGDISARIAFAAGRSTARRTAARMRGHLADWPAAVPVAAVVRTMLKQVRCHDADTGGLSSYAQQVMVLHVCSRARDSADAAAVLRSFLSFYSKFEYDRLCLLPFEDEGEPKTTDEEPQQVCIRDPYVPGGYVAARCTKLAVIKQQFKYCLQALHKWDGSASQRRGYKGRTPLSTIISLQPLWPRAAAHQRPCDSAANAGDADPSPAEPRQGLR